MITENNVLEVIRYSLGRKRKSFGHGYEAAYHSVNLRGKKFNGQRDVSERLAKVNFDFKDKIVLDIGCNIGGMLHCISDEIKSGIGIDSNYKCINAANLISKFNCAHNLSFYTFNLDKEPLDLLKKFTMDENIDICFVLSIALWVKRWKEVIRWCYESSNNILYEAHGRDDFQKEQIMYLKSFYSSVNLISLQALDDHESSRSNGKLNRKTFLCKK